MATKKTTVKQAPKKSPAKKKAPAKPTPSTPDSTATKQPDANETAVAAARPKPTEPKGPGVISSIVELLTAASEKSPLSKPAMLDKLIERFPNREPDAMRKTINCQVPTRLAKEKGLHIDKNKEGYWIA